MAPVINKPNSYKNSIWRGAGKGEVKLLCAGLMLVSCVLPGLALDKKDLQAEYHKKFVVVLKDGLAVGVCAARRQALLRTGMGGNAPVSMPVWITKSGATYKAGTGIGAGFSGCRELVPQSIRKGEVLAVDRTFFYRGRDFTLVVADLSPGEIEVRPKSSRRRAYERGTAEFRFKVEDAKDYDAIAALVAQWVKVFDSKEAAAQFANTPSR
jgi:hypothetical protein